MGFEIPVVPKKEEKKEEKKGLNPNGARDLEKFPLGDWKTKDGLLKIAAERRDAAKKTLEQIEIGTSPHDGMRLKYYEIQSLQEMADNMNKEAEEAEKRAEKMVG